MLIESFVGLEPNILLNLSRHIDFTLNLSRQQLTLILNMSLMWEKLIGGECVRESETKLGKCARQQRKMLFSLFLLSHFSAAAERPQKSQVNNHDSMSSTQIKANLFARARQEEDSGLRRASVMFNNINQGQK